jgi:hypothetical protein
VVDLFCERFRISAGREAALGAVRAAREQFQLQELETEAEKVEVEVEVKVEVEVEQGEGGQVGAYSTRALPPRGIARGAPLAEAEQAAKAVLLPATRPAAAVAAAASASVSEAVQQGESGGVEGGGGGGAGGGSEGRGGGEGGELRPLLFGPGLKRDPRTGAPQYSGFHFNKKYLGPAYDAM